MAPTLRTPRKAQRTEVRIPSPLVTKNLLPYFEVIECDIDPITSLSLIQALF